MAKSDLRMRWDDTTSTSLKCPLTLNHFSVFSLISQVNKPCASIWDYRIKMCTSTITWCHLSQRPPSSPVTFPVLCPSWVMDYLSAVSQYNHIQLQSFPKMMPLFISSLVRQSYYYLALVFPPSTFNYSPSCSSYNTVRLELRCTLLQLLCVFATWV